MRKRPLAVTVIAWILIVPGIAALLILPWAWAALSHAASHAVGVREMLAKTTLGELVITGVFGLFLLRGANLARWLYLAWTAFQWIPFLTQAHPAPWVIALNLVIDLVILAFLFGPKANAYFRPRPLPEA